ncbi:MAG: HAD hydrolase-like protein [Ignisphaera sp.]|uniref:HAD family hydrolase n=1 Tax=Ignisphaera aggregans TaxID=334771 RepID=A0A7J3MWN6_9CREN
MVKQKIGTIIFDIDGTIVLLPIDWDNILIKIKSLSLTSTKTFLGFVSKYYGSNEFIYIHKYLEDIENSAVDSMLILDNADKLLKRVCRYIPIGFVTMQSRSAAEKIVYKMGLCNCDKFLGVLASREDASNRIEQLAKAIKSIDINPDEVLFIGDKVLDGIAAIVNKVKSIVILRNPRTFRISDTDYIDEDLETIGIPIATDLAEALAIAKDIYDLPIDISIG